MAFGVICSTLLVSVMGVAPARASAGVHFVEMFTTGASGISHVLHKNVDWKLFSRIAIPGVIGGCTGAYLLASIHTEAARPFVMGYLTLIGFYLLYKAWGFSHEHKPRDPKVTMPLGLIGGFLDASGGGGWGGGNGGGNGGGWGGGNSNYSVTCSSNNNRQQSCNWDERQGRPVLQQQLSGSACQEGRTWGYSRGNVWVSNGCRARFGTR